MSDERRTIRCPGCELVQFETRTGACRRCGAELEPAPRPDLSVQAHEMVPAEAAPARPCAERGDAATRIPARVLQLREWRRMSQRMLAARMACPRTYISKIENGGVVPTLDSLERMAGALRVPMVVLVMEPAEFGAWFRMEVDAKNNMLLHAVLRELPRLGPEERLQLLGAAKALCDQREGKAA